LLSMAKADKKRSRSPVVRASAFFLIRTIRDIVESTAPVFASTTSITASLSSTLG
jgi:hypothetical protein